MVMEGILAELAKQGILGLVATLAIIVAWRKDKQVNALYSRLEARAEKMLDKYHILASELKMTLHELVRDLEATPEPEPDDESGDEPDEPDDNSNPNHDGGEP